MSSFADLEVSPRRPCVRVAFVIYVLLWVLFVWMVFTFLRLLIVPDLG